MFVVVQSLSHVQLFATPWTAAYQASLSFTISQSSLRLTSIESVMPSNHLILWCPFSSCPQYFPTSGSFPMARHIRSPKHWNFCFIISPSNEYSGLISFKINWFDLSVQRTLSPVLLSISSSVFLVQSLFGSSALFGSSLSFLLVKLLTITHSSPQFCEYLYDHSLSDKVALKLFFWDFILSLIWIILFFFLILPILLFSFYIFGRLVMFTNLGEVSLCKRHPMEFSIILLSDHQCYTL